MRVACNGEPCPRLQRPTASAAPCSIDPPHRRLQHDPTRSHTSHQGLDLGGKCENGSDHVGAFGGVGRCCMALQMRSAAATEDKVHHYTLPAFSQSESDT